jgi:hypothetical protein
MQGIPQKRSNGRMAPSILSQWMGKGLRLKRDIYPAMSSFLPVDFISGGFQYSQKRNIIPQQMGVYGDPVV